MRRKDREQKGFILDIERGYWARNESDPDDEADPLSTSMSRVIPYVEDRRNALLFEPQKPLDEKTMASLQAALKSAIQVEYELEDNELSSEPLPTRDIRRLILFYESAEGGAGVLRRLIDDPNAIAAVARRALDICHFNPETGEDVHRAPQSREDCEAACYDCLMTYSNQSDHDILDRKAIQEILQRLSKSVVQSAPSALPRTEHLNALMKLAGSKLEKDWLQLLEKNNLRLPSRSQVMMEKCQTRPDFLYDEEMVAIYIDGPHHLFPDRHKRDVLQTECMQNSGFTVARFAHTDDWIQKIREFPNVFGSMK
jgi:very-short-patch-repair endonuclease